MSRTTRTQDAPTIGHVLPVEWLTDARANLATDSRENELQYFMEITIDSHVGAQCASLFHLVEAMKGLGVEPRDLITIRRAAIATMMAWWLG